MAYLLNQPYSPTNPEAPVPPDMLARQRQFGEAELQSGMDTSPIRSPWQGAARLAQALMGGMAVRKANTQEMGYRSKAMQGLIDAMQGSPVPDMSGNAGPENVGSSTPGVAAVPQARTGPDINKILMAGSDPYLSAGGQGIANALIAHQYKMYDPIKLAPGETVTTAQQALAGGSGYHRGDGSPYDIEQASKAYDYQFGPAANRAMNAPDPQAWYKSAWPIYGTGDQGGQPARPQADQSAAPQANPPAGGLPKRAPSEADTLRWDRASNALVKNYIENPAYKLVANGGPFLARIDAAAKLPGSAVNDQELLDSLTKLNTGGGQVTEAQVNLVTKGGSLTDKINVWKNMMGGQGGVLSPDQRAEIVTLAHKVFGEYQNLLTPYYNDATAKLKAQGVPEEYWTIPDVSTLSKQGGITPPGGGSPGDPIGEAQRAIAAGVPREEVIKRLQENGVDPSGL